MKTLIWWLMHILHNLSITTVSHSRFSFDVAMKLPRLAIIMRNPLPIKANDKKYNIGCASPKAKSLTSLILTRMIWCIWIRSSSRIKKSPNATVARPTIWSYNSGTFLGKSRNLRARAIMIYATLTNMTDEKNTERALKSRTLCPRLSEGLGNSKSLSSKWANGANLTPIADPCFGRV